MPQIFINIGNAANDGTGTPLRTAFDICNDNFTELYNSLGVTGLANGTSNIQVRQSANITFGVANIANVVVVSSNAMAVSGNVSAQFITGSGNITGNYFIGNGRQLTGVLSTSDAALIIGNTLSANVTTSSLSAVGVLANLSVAGNVVSGNVNTPGVVSATGNVVALNVNALGLVSAVGNVIADNGQFAQDVSASGAVSAVGNVSGQYFLGNGALLAGINATANAAYLTGITLSANILNSSLVTLGNLNWLNVSNALGGNGTVTSDALSVANAAVVTGNITGGNVATAGKVTAGSVTATGNIQALNLVANATVGNVSANNFTATTLVTATRITATGNIQGGNVSAVGNTQTGNLSAVGTVYAGTDMVSAGTISAAATITGGNLNTGGTVSATGNVIGGNLSAVGQINGLGNIVGGNILTNGLASAQGNIIAANFSTTGIVSASGNVVGSFFVGNGSQLTGVTATGVGVLTSLSVTGNVEGGNIRTQGVISSTGNIQSAGSFVGSGAGLTAIPGANVTGTVANAAFATSAAAATTATSATSATTATTAGTVTSAVQSNITGVGTLTSLSVSGTVTVNSSSGATAIINGAGNGVGNIGSSSGYFNRLFATATTAQYADLAEMYAADRDYEPGTVVVFGGSDEITISTVSHSTAVAGIISSNPCHLMNSSQRGVHVLPVALTGRVYCRVQGPVTKGDVLVTGTEPGTAQKIGDVWYPGCVLGKSLEVIDDGHIHVIEVAVGRF